MITEITIEYTERGSSALHRLHTSISDQTGFLVPLALESFVDGEWVKASDTQRGVARFHQQTLLKMVRAAETVGIRELRVVLP